MIRDELNGSLELDAIRSMCRMGYGVDISFPRLTEEQQGWDTLFNQDG